MRAPLLGLVLWAPFACACAVDEEGQLRRALEGYVDVLASLPTPPLLLGLAVDSLAAQYDGSVKITGIRSTGGRLGAIARYREAPTLVCAVRLRPADQVAPLLPPSERGPPTCEGGAEALLKAALWEYTAAQRMYRLAHQLWVDRIGPRATSLEELDLVPPAGVTTTILTVSPHGHSAIATHDTVPDLVCAMHDGWVPAPLRDTTRADVACGRDARLAAQALGRPPPRDTVAVVSDHVLAVGGTHACVLQAERVMCWGDDRFGQLGDGVVLGRTRSSLVVTDARLRSVAAGYAHTCGLDGEGRAYCWGANARGELGDGTLVDRAAPVAVAGGRRFVGIAAGPGISCGLTADGAAYCWGLEAPTPQAISSPVAFRSFASSFCGVSVDDVPHCWLKYWATDDQSWDVARPARTTARFRVVNEGYGLPEDEPEWPFLDPSLTRLGFERGCGVTRDERVLCWIVRSSAFPAGRSDSIFATPVRVPSLRTVVVGADHACGLAAEGTAHCWSVTEVRQGFGDTRLELSDPVVVGTSLRFRTIAAYGNRTCGTAEPDGALFCWRGATVTPTRVTVSAEERIRALASDLPNAGPRDTSEHWGFTFPRASGIRFEGAVACDRYAARVQEGPDGGPVVRILFLSAWPSIDRLGDDLSLGGALILGGFRWRIAMGYRHVTGPIFDEEGNEREYTLENPRIARGRVYRERRGCALTMEYERDMRGEEPDVLIDVLRALRFPADIDSGSVAANERGMVRYRAGEYAEALTEFERAAALDDQNAEAINNVGFVLYRLGRLEESVPWYRRAIELDPQRAVAYLNLGDSLEERGYHPEAVEVYERYLELDPEGGAAERVRTVLGRQ